MCLISENHKILDGYCENCSRVHRAGPREEIYFRPEEVKAAIVTCGGLCPGLNDVIRHVSNSLSFINVNLLLVFFLEISIHSSC